MIDCSIFSCRSTLLLLLFFLVISSCTVQPVSLITEPTFLGSDPLMVEYDFEGKNLKKISIELTCMGAYSNLSMKSEHQVYLDHLDIPDTGHFRFEVLINLATSEKKQFAFSKIGADLMINRIEIIDAQDIDLPDFQDASDKLGLNTEYTWKYGGPSIADINNDGYYDFILNNHDKVPAKLFWNEKGKKVVEHDKPLMRWDIHGTAAGDYDKDGDLDILISQGGGNGTNPQPPHLLRNDNGQFTVVTKESGITQGSRGRSVRWIDMDLDGDLDLIFVNAQGLNTLDGATHVFYKNLGNGNFENIGCDSLESIYAERILVTDINNDFIDDLIMFEPLSIWIGQGDFSFKEVSSSWLPENLKGLGFITAVAPIDLENDGDIDLYLSRGKTYYQMANKSLDFNPETKRVDIRDEGNKGTTSVEFEAEDSIILSGIFLWYRLYDGGFPIHLGRNKTTVHLNEKDRFTIRPYMAIGWPEVRNENGWYLGYLGSGKWRMEWLRNDDIYWGIRISIQGVDGIQSKWTPQNRNVQDILLRNGGGTFTNVFEEWNIPQGGNHQGVTVGDFNNDSHMDLFVYRFGFLRSRVSDWLLINNGKGRFEQTTSHGARDFEDPGHGDMGQAFDFDLDGDIDLLSGSDNPGKWYLYQNNEKGNKHHVLVRVGNSPKEKVDPISAVVTVETSKNLYKRRVGSAGAVHSQSLLNTIHFGLGKENYILKIQVRWRNGEVAELDNIKANQLYHIPVN